MDTPRSSKEVLEELQAEGVTDLPHEVLEAAEQPADSADTGEESAQAKRDKAALEDKGALKPCEACGGEFGPFPFRSFLQSVEDGTMRRGVGLEVVKSMCSNCGLLRLHVADLLFYEDGEGDDAAR